MLKHLRLVRVYVERVSVDVLLEVPDLDVSVGSHCDEVLQHLAAYVEFDELEQDDVLMNLTVSMTLLIVLSDLLS